MGINQWADTSAILYPTFNTTKTAISAITIQELEGIKNSQREENVKFHAREAVRKILNDDTYEVIISNNQKIDKMLKKYTFLNNINDHRILCAAEIYAEETHTRIAFLTCDSLQYIFAT